MRDSDFDKLLKKVSAIKPKPIKKAAKNTSCLVVCLSDWQIGKENTELAVENYLNGINKIKKHVTDLRKKHTIDKLVLVGMGDLLENCGNQFAPNGLWEQVYDGRQQMMIARRMLTKTIEILAPTFSEILCVAVAGNHGEKRQNKKMETSYGDNLDYELFDNVAEIFDKATGFKHVKFYIPENELTISIEVLPKVILSATHGHLARAGGTASHKILNWFIELYALYKKTDQVQYEVPTLESIATLTKQVIGAETIDYKQATIALAKCYCRQKDYTKFDILISRYSLDLSCG
jgi:hypothetical protein